MKFLAGSAGLGSTGYSLSVRTITAKKMCLKQNIDKDKYPYQREVAE